MTPEQEAWKEHLKRYNIWKTSDIKGSQEVKDEQEWLSMPQIKRLIQEVKTAGFSAGQKSNIEETCLCGDTTKNDKMCDTCLMQHDDKNRSRLLAEIKKEIDRLDEKIEKSIENHKWASEQDHDVALVDIKDTFMVKLNEFIDRVGKK